MHSPTEDSKKQTYVSQPKASCLKLKNKMPQTPPNVVLSKFCYSAAPVSLPYHSPPRGCFFGRLSCSLPLCDGFLLRRAGGIFSGGLPLFAVMRRLSIPPRKRHLFFRHPFTGWLFYFYVALQAAFFGSVGNGSFVGGTLHDNTKHPLRTGL